MRTRLTAEELKAFVAHLPPQHSKVVATLRRLIHRAAPNAAETLLWDSLSYHRQTFGGRIKGAICLITPRLDCVHLGFIHGAAIADPDHLLRGAGKAKRFVPIRDVRDIDGQALSRLVKAAGEYDPRKLT